MHAIISCLQASAVRELKKSFMGLKFCDLPAKLTDRLKTFHHEGDIWA